MGLLVIAVLGVYSGCATSKFDMAWVRNDGRRIVDDPALLSQGQTDVALCHANLDSGGVDQVGRDCMAKKGYALVRKDQAEQARAGFAAVNLPRDAPQESAPSTPNQIPSSPVEVPLKKDRGTFVVPVQINGAITLDFTIDSGASDVSVPADVFSTLTRTGTIKTADIIGEKTYVLADGSKSQSVTFNIRSLKVGNRLVENVRGSVAPVRGSLLLGQSFLERFKSWSIDNTKHELVLKQ
jgi:clan AA aspartic protease (TIGR02281 family)